MHVRTTTAHQYSDPSLCYCTATHQRWLVAGPKVVVKVMKSLYIAGHAPSPAPLHAADYLSNSTVS